MSNHEQVESETRKAKYEPRETSGNEESETRETTGRVKETYEETEHEKSKSETRESTKKVKDIPR